MNKLILIAAIFLLLIQMVNVSAQTNSENVSPQPVTDLDWWETAHQRLKALYDRGEFKPDKFETRWLDDSSGYTVEERKTRWRYDARTGERTKASASNKPGKLHSPDGKFRLASRRARIVAINVETDEPSVLVKDTGDRDVSCRKLSWSPDGKYVAFAEFDRSDVRLRSVLVPSDPSYPDTKENRFARVGGKIDAIRVGIINVNTKDLRWVELNMPAEGFYLGQMDWAPGSDQLLIETFSRFRDKREFWLASFDGKLERIFGEVNDAWAVASHMINWGAEWIDDGKAFIFISEKEGWRQAYLCSRDGKKETKLTPGEFDIIGRAFVDQADGWYYFYASPDNATQKYLYRVGLDGSGKLEKISPADQPGTHDYEASPDGKLAIHTYSTINSPPVIELVELPSHKSLRTINDHSRLRARAKDLIKSPTEFVQIDIGEGVVMDASITKPSEFDESKKYPVFVYVYGEPHLQTVLDSWGSGQVDFHRVVANAGYVVVSIDNRGTAAPKGSAWRRSVFGSLGPLSTEDQAAALKQLGQMRSYLDLSRVGIWGWSGGGSNTLNAMFRKPDVYHVGIAVVPKPQPWLYNAWFQEIYMRTREVNAEGYEKSAPINFAEGLKGKLLIVTGSGETNTHIQIIEGLVDKLVELGKPFDYMVYPNRDHGLREGPGSVVHVRMLVLRYLIENLPRGPR